MSADGIDLSLIAFLAREINEEWTLRFMRERDMPKPTDAELREIIALGKSDELSAHQ